MGLRNLDEGLRALQGMGADVQDVLKVFGRGLVESGILIPAAKPAAKPAAATRAVQPTLGLRERRGATSATGQNIGGRYYGEAQNTPRNTETIRIGESAPRLNLGRESAAPLARRPVPGQMSIFSAPEPRFRTTPAQGPESREALALYDRDPGTFKTLEELAQRATSYYGKPVSVDDLMRPDATRFLRELESGGGAVPPRGTTTVAGQQPGGALVPSPGGAVSPQLIRTPSNVIDADYSLIRDLPAGKTGSAVGTATTDLGRMVRGLGLNPAQIAALVAGGTAVGGAALTGLMSRNQNESKPPISVTDEGTYIDRNRTRTPEEQRLLDQASQILVDVYQRKEGETSAQSNTAPRDRAATPRMADPSASTGSSGRPAGVPTPRSTTGQTGSGQVILTQDDRESGYRQELANALAGAQRGGGFMPVADPNRPIADYYRAREQYVRQPGMAAELALQASQLPGAAPSTPAWAAANPTLAYEMLQRSKARPDLSQQTPQAQSVVVGSQLGDNNANNMVGNAAYGASAAVDRSAGASDLEDSTRPLIRPRIDRIPLGGRMVPAGGGYPATPFG